MSKLKTAVAVALLFAAEPCLAGEILPRGSRICTEPIAGGSCVRTGRDVRVLPSADPGRVYVPGQANPVFVRERALGEEGGLRPFGR